MSKRHAFLVIALVLLSAGASVAASGGQQSTAARVVDRAFLCTNALSQKNARQLTVSANRGDPQTGEWVHLASGSVISEGQTQTRVGPDASGARRTVYTQWDFSFSAGNKTLRVTRYAPRHFSIWANWAKACRTVATSRVPLTTRGLGGGAADEYNDTFDCVIPRRVLIRTRGIFVSAAKLERNSVSGYLSTAVPLREAATIVRTETGRPLAFVSVSDSGRARLFTSPQSCFP